MSLIVKGWFETWMGWRLVKNPSWNGAYCDVEMDDGSSDEYRVDMGAIPANEDEARKLTVEGWKHRVKI